MTVSALNAAGEVVEEESYSNCAPDMVENGESMFIWDWFYGFETPIDEIAGFAVTVERAKRAATPNTRRSTRRA